MAKDPDQSSQMTVRLLSTEKGERYWGAGGEEGVSFNVQLVGEVEAMHTRLTFAECGNSSPVGGSAAHVVEAGGSQLIGGVRLETCTEWIGCLVHIID